MIPAEKNQDIMNIFWKKYCKTVRLFLSITLIVSFLSAEKVAAQTYLNSAHGNSTTGVERTALGSGEPDTARQFAIGNCAHCHEQHASVGGVEPAPDNTGPDIYLGFGAEEQLCYGCHGSAGLGTARDNIQNDTDNLAKPYGHGQIMNSVDYSHRANETVVDNPLISTSAHVECMDCHNPHMARTENDGTIGPRAKGNNVIGSNSPLLGVSGVEFSTYPTGWLTSLTTWNAAPIANYTFLNDNPAGEGYSTKEYQICFKCHSSFSGNTDSWDGATDPGSWTDVALEFNPANASGHPIVTSLNLYSGNIVPKPAAQLLAPWAANVGDNLMYCSDCHASGDAATSDRYGPHGSATKWMLAGTYQNWPYTTTAGNGTSTGTFITLTNPVEDQNFCANCHNISANPGGLYPHAQTEHDSAACVNCHIRVPHGGKVSRLISAAANTANLPNRYWPDGNGGGNIGITNFQKDTAGGYQESNCVSVAGRGGCSWHNSYAVTGAHETW